MARQLGDFIESYLDYSRDGFVPERFHRWAALSILAAAIERKITLKQDLIYYVPNIYVMLVGHPKSGKSTAVVRAVDLVEELKKLQPHFRILPNQMTEPAFVDLMKIVDRVPIPGTTQLLVQSAGFFYASEASSSALKDPDGFIVSSFTDFWDCPKWFRKKLKTERDSVEIENACLNLLAGTTFHFLKSLINEQSVLGGFASRLIYVTSEEKTQRAGKWESGLKLDTTLKAKLIQDLQHINGLVGPMKPTQEWINCYEKWVGSFNKWYNELESPRLAGIMARKDTNLVKVSMLLSISESDSLILEARHFERAIELIEDVYKDNPGIVAAAAMSEKDTQSGVTQAIGQIVKRHGGRINVKLLHNLVMSNGNDVGAIKQTFDFMRENGYLKHDLTNNTVELLVDPDRYL